MTQNKPWDFQTRLEICEAEKKDLQDEVNYMKESIKTKNEEIGSLKSKLRNSVQELSELEHFLLGQVSAITARLTKPVQVPLHPSHEHGGGDQNDQNANQEVLHHSVLSQATQSPSKETVPNPLFHDTDVPAPQPTLPSSSTQPVKPILISDNDQLPPVKKSLFECEKCKEKFCTAVKLNNHMYTMHGNSSSSEDPFTPIANAEKNKARKLRNRNKKVKLEPEPSTLASSTLMNVSKAQVNCPGCGKTMRKDSLAKHSKISCKGKQGDSRGGGAAKVTGQPVEEISFKIRSTYNDENLLVKMKVKPSITIGKVKDKFSRRLSVSMDRLVMRCNGKLLENEEIVRKLESQTVWLSVVEVKDEES